MQRRSINDKPQAGAGIMLRTWCVLMVGSAIALGIIGWLMLQ